MKPRIPSALTQDKALVILASRWRNLLEQHAECRKRVNWTTKNAARIEKERRAKRWEVEATLNEVEHTILKMCAEHTHHHEIYTPTRTKSDPLDRQTFSLLDNLLREYYRQKQVPGPHHLNRTVVMRKRTRRRHVIVKEIQALTWKWCSAVYKAIFPQQKLPPKRKTDYRVLRPKRLHAAHNKFVS